MQHPCYDKGNNSHLSVTSFWSREHINSHTAEQEAKFNGAQRHGEAGENRAQKQAAEAADSYLLSSAPPPLLYGPRVRFLKISRSSLFFSSFLAGQRLTAVVDEVTRPQ